MPTLDGQAGTAGRKELKSQFQDPIDFRVNETHDSSLHPEIAVLVVVLALCFSVGLLALVQIF